MTTARAIMLLALLGVQPMCLFSASYGVSPPDPVGEKVYSSGQLERVVVPVAVIAVGFSAAWVIDRIRRHTRKLTLANGEAHHR